MYNIKEYDPITRFRLRNLFMIGVGLSLLSPVIVSLKGTLLSVQLIAILGIITTLAVYSNGYFSKFRLSTLYRLGIGVHIILILSTMIYFVNPFVMILLETVVGVLEVTVFSAYQIVLNQYITDFYPKSMKKFQVLRNSLYATSGLIGLGLSVILGYFGTSVSIGVFVVYNTIFCIYLLKNWNFFDNPDFAGYKIKETK